MSIYLLVTTRELRLEPADRGFDVRRADGLVVVAPQGLEQRGKLVRNLITC